MVWPGTFDRRSWVSRILAALLGLGAWAVAAEQVQLGRVVAVEPDGVIVALPGTGREVRIPMPSAETTARPAPGSLVRVWSRTDDDGGDVDMRLELPDTGHDRTGVRARLSRGAGRRPGGGGRGGR